MCGIASDDLIVDLGLNPYNTFRAGVWVRRGEIGCDARASGGRTEEEAEKAVEGVEGGPRVVFSLQQGIMLILRRMAFLLQLQKSALRRR